MLRQTRDVRLPDPAGGVVTVPNIFSLQPNQSPNAMNVRFLVGGSIEKRLGVSSINTTVLVSSAATGFSPDAGPTLANNLIAFWKFDEASGTRLDEFGGHNLSDNNTVTSSAGTLGNAAQFASANEEYLLHANTSTLATGLVNFSMSAWINLASTGVRTIFAKRDGPLAAGSGASVTLTGALVAYWNLNEASGTRSDTAGSEHLTDVATVGQTTGRVAQAALFTRANANYLTRDSDAVLQLGQTNLTIGAWVYMNSKPTDNMAIFGKGRFVNAADVEYILYWGSATDLFYFDVGNGLGAVGSTSAGTFGAPSTATWYLVLGMYDSGAGRVMIQVNNAATDGAAYTSGGQKSNQGFNIGRWSDGTGFWNGPIDEVGIWKGRVLSAAERTDLYNSGNGRTYPFTAVSVTSGSEYEYWFYVNSDNVLTFRASSSGGAENGTVRGTSFGALSTATWYFVTAQVDSSNATNPNIGVSVNLSLTTAAYTAGVRAGSAPFVVGAVSNGAHSFMDGRIDLGGFWKGKVFTAAERSDLYNAAAGNQYSPGASNAGWAATDFGAGASGGLPIRWLVVAAGTGIAASSNRGVTFVTVATDRGASYQSFERSKSFLIATADSENKVLYWAGSPNTYFAALAPGSAPPAKYAADFAGFLLLMNDSGGRRRISYADNAASTTDPWTSTFELPSSLDDEITGSAVLNKKLYVFSKQKVMRISHVGGNPDFAVQEVKSSWGAVPRTIKKVTIPQVGEVIIALGWDKHLRLFDGDEDQVISDPVFDNNGLCPVSLSQIEPLAIAKSFAELDNNEQVYKLWLAMAPSTDVTHMLAFNVRTRAFYWYDNQPFNTAVMADSGNRRDLIGVRRNGFVYWMDTSFTDQGTAVDEYYELPFFMGRTPSATAKGHQIDLYFSATSAGTLYFQDRTNFSTGFNPARALVFGGSGEAVQIRKSIDLPVTQNIWQGRLSSSAGTTAPWKLNYIAYHPQDLGIGETNG